jgi:hypothetical protein
VGGVCGVLRRCVRGRAALAAGRVCAVFPFFFSAVPVPYRGEMELPGLAPPAPQPRVCSLSSDSGAGAGAIHRLAPPPTRTCCS